MQGGLVEAQHALTALETKRLQNQYQRAQTQLKKPGLNADSIAKLMGESQQLKECLDRRARLPDIAPPSVT